ncbi:MAG: hypothetical protein ACOCRX_02330 [Candidatus Woesearchaeota archaeon]
MEETIKALKTLRTPLITQETDLHSIIAKCLMENNIPFEKEYYLGPRSRIDFLAKKQIGIEVKKEKPNNTHLKKQIKKYCKYEIITGLIIVTPWARHLNIPNEVNGKPIYIISLNKLWGLAF